MDGGKLTKRAWERCAVVLLWCFVCGLSERERESVCLSVCLVAASAPVCPLPSDKSCPYEGRKWASRRKHYQNMLVRLTGALRSSPHPSTTHTFCKLVHVLSHVLMHVRVPCRAVRGVDRGWMHWTYMQSIDRVCERTAWDVALSQTPSSFVCGCLYLVFGVAGRSFVFRRPSARAWLGEW